MRTLLLLLLFLGAFLVMDGAHRDSMRAAVREAEARGRGSRGGREPSSLLDLQFSSRREQEFSGLFDSTGPWAYRDDLSGDSLSPRRLDASDGPPPAASAGPGDAAAGPGDAAAGPGDAAGVEGFWGAGGGRPGFLDGLGDPAHAQALTPGPPRQTGGERRGAVSSRAAGVRVSGAGETFGRATVPGRGPSRSQPRPPARARRDLAPPQAGRVETRRS